MQNNKINVTELDFDLIKSNLKTFLQGQDKFSDYDFEGSGLSILLDVLAYNTHYNALYTNLAVNESFLDSASKRNSVVSLAKALGYTPDSATGAIARINLIVAGTSSTPAVLTLPKYTQFGTTVDGETYNFYTLEDHIANLDTTDNSYTFSNIEIKEGTPLTFRYEVYDGQKYILPNNNVDISTLRVRVQDNLNSSLFTTYTNEEELIDLDSNSLVYFLKEIEGEFYEIEFGNNVIGKQPTIGGIVTIEYLTCNASLANGAKIFTYQGSSLLGGIITVVTTVAAQEGVDKEDIDSIRYNAPRSYSAQNRGVTVNDYKSIIMEQYTEAESVNVWGGEDNVPPVYGKVFIAIKPKTTNLLSRAQKDIIINNILKPRNVVSITPEIVDPEYIDIEVNSTVYFNPKVTTKKENDIKFIVQTAIQEYSENNLDSYDGIFRFSKFSSTIDNVDVSIVSNITTVKLHREVQVKYNTNAVYSIELGNPIYNSGKCNQSIVTSGFYVPEYEFPVYLEDYPETAQTDTGEFRMFYIDENDIKQYVRTLGSVNYRTGSISISNLNIVGIDSEVFKFIIKPSSNDIVSIRNQLVRILPELVNINIVTDKVATGDAAGNSNYVFTTSRN